MQGMYIRNECEEFMQIMHVKNALKRERSTLKCFQIYYLNHHYSILVRASKVKPLKGHSLKIYGSKKHQLGWVAQRSGAVPEDCSNWSPVQVVLVVQGAHTLV